MALLLVLAGCGADPGDGSSPPATGSAAGPAGVHIAGTITGDAETRDTLLVFAFASLSADQSPAEAEPACISGVGPAGEFVLTVTPSERLAVVFLHDKENDGAIDAGDPIAILDDPESRLLGLGDGDAVELSSITIDFGGKRARAESIQQNGVPASTPSVTADPS